MYDRAFQPDGCLGHSENMLKTTPFLCSSYKNFLWYLMICSKKFHDFVRRFWTSNGFHERSRVGPLHFPLFSHSPMSWPIFAKILQISSWSINIHKFSFKPKVDPWFSGIFVAWNPLKPAISSCCNQVAAAAASLAPGSTGAAQSYLPGSPDVIAMSSGAY